MSYFLVKVLISAKVITVVSEVARRSSALGALIASLPLISVLGMNWLWRDRPDVANMAEHAEATFWFVLPSLPMFLLIPGMLRNGFSFLVALVIGCAVTVALYSLMVWVGPRFGIRLYAEALRKVSHDYERLLKAARNFWGLYWGPIYNHIA